MPVKIYLLASLITVAALLCIFILTKRLIKALRYGNSLQKIREAFFCVLLITLGLYLADTLLPCFRFSTNPLCQGSSQNKWITLSIDDGPNEPYTSEILDLLDQKHVPATFFLVGRNIERHPEVVRRMVKEGYSIGNHTYDHKPLIRMNQSETLDEIEHWEKVSKPIVPEGSHLLRTPHGWKNIFLSSILKNKGYRLIGWTLGVWDSDRPGKEELLRRLKGRVKNGAIILLHDGDGDKEGADRSQTVELLPDLIDYCHSEGFQFVSLETMLNLHE